MKLSKEYTFIALLVLTLVSSIITMKTSEGNTTIYSLLLILWAAKFILVAFDFMELKKANIFWKLSLGFVLALVLTIILLFLWFFFQKPDKYHTNKRHFSLKFESLITHTYTPILMLSKATIFNLVRNFKELVYLLKRCISNYFFESQYNV